MGVLSPARELIYVASLSSTIIVSPVLTASFAPGSCLFGRSLICTPLENYCSSTGAVPSSSPDPVPSKDSAEELANAPRIPRALKAKLVFSTAKLTDDLDVFSRPVTYVTAYVEGAKKWKLNAAISKLTEAQRKPYARIALDGLTDEEFESLLAEVTSDVQAMVADNEKTEKALEAASHRPGIGNIEVNGKASKDELDSVMKGIH